MKRKINEQFPSELEVGTSYYFTYQNDKILYGVFKRKTPAWLIFDVDGEEVWTKPWANVSTDKEDIEQVIGIVDRLEKDTKIPATIPNRFTPVANQHNKPFGESTNTLKENNNSMNYFMDIMEFGETAYIVGATEEEWFKNARDALEHMAITYGGYDSYEEYLEVVHDVTLDEINFAEWLEDYYGAHPLKINTYYVWGE